MTHPTEARASGAPPSPETPEATTADLLFESPPSPPGSRWIELTGPAAARPAERPVRLRRVVLLVAVAAVAVVALVGLVGSIVARQTAESQAVHDAAQLSDVLAESVVQPALTDAMVTNPSAATAVLGPIVTTRVLSNSLVRVKLWTPAGVVLYSDEPRLIGQSFDLEDDAREALTTPRTQAGISDLNRPENQFERGQGKLLEVYRPVWTPSGEPLLFEAYFNYASVSERSQQLWRAFFGIMVSSLVALLLLLVPLVWALVARIRQTKLEQEAVARRALDVSDDERRRIAASLHDGVAQQLAAASFAVAGEAEHLAAAGDLQRANALREAAAAVRGGIAGLRSVLVDIYPASLRAAGLSTALRDLTASLGAEVDLDIDAEAADTLPAETQEAVFRVAQEGLRNVVRHAGAAHVALRLVVVDDTVVRLELVDDGVGLDIDGLTLEERPEHFGLRLMRDVATGIGASLTLASEPGEGTALRLEVPRT